MHENKDSRIHGLIAEVLEHHPATLSLDLAFNVGACRLYSNSPEAITRLERHYQAFETQRSHPDFLVTVIECGKVAIDKSYNLHLAGEQELIIGSDLVDELDERLEYDRVNGILKLSDHGHCLIAGPCLKQFDVIVGAIYDLYLEWKWRSASQAASV